eukprot:7328-Heterococcus_DN1.PRE.3
MLQCNQTNAAVQCTCRDKSNYHITHQCVSMCETISAVSVPLLRLAATAWHVHPSASMSAQSSHAAAFRSSHGFSSSAAAPASMLGAAVALADVLSPLHICLK